MARKCLKLRHYSNMLLNLILYSVFGELAFAFPSYRESRLAESSEKPTSAAPNVQQVRYRPSCASHFPVSSHSTYLLSLMSYFSGYKTPFRGNRVCCGRYCCCNSSCCLHHTKILLSEEV